MTLFHARTWNKTREAREFWENRATSGTESVTSAGGSIMTVSDRSIALMTSLSNEIDRFYTANISHPDESDRYVIDHLDASQCFHKYQMHVRDLPRLSRLALKNYYHHVLSLSSILLLEKDPVNRDFESFFTNHGLANFSSYLTVELQMDGSHFDHNSVSEMLPYGSKSKRKVCRRAISCEEGCHVLSGQIQRTNGATQRIVRFVKSALEFFSMKSDTELIREQDLRSRFILPIIQALFNQDRNDDTCYFRLNGENNADCRTSKFVISRRQPDG